MKEQIFAQIVSLLAQEYQDFEGDLDCLEGHVQDDLRQIGKAGMQRVLQQRKWGHQGNSLPCDCGGRQRFIGYRPRWVVTLLGTMRLHRAYYHCSGCGTSSVPYDRASGLGGGHLSNGLAAAVSLLAVDISFENACRKTEKLLGIKTDDNAAVKAVEHAGAELMARQREAIEQFQKNGQVAEPPESPKRLYVSSDGAMAPIRPHPGEGKRKDSIEWREVKCASAWWEDGPEDKPIRHQRYRGRIEPAASFGWTWWLLAAQCGLRGALEVVVLGDGAVWIWNQAARFFRGAIQILDWYHAMEHVWACGAGLYGQGTAQSERWVKQMETIMWESGGAALLKRLRQFQRRRLEPCEALEDLIGYIEPNVARMDYPTHRAAGRKIGSGPIESACKQLVTARLKQAGMRWTVAGAEQTLALRCCWLNGDWDAFWQSKPLAA